jgi:hypothetical protein
MVFLIKNSCDEIHWVPVGYSPWENHLPKNYGLFLWTSSQQKGAGVFPNLCMHRLWGGDRNRSFHFLASALQGFRVGWCGGSFRLLFFIKKIECRLGIMMCARGYKMNSHASLFDPKKYSCVWCWFGHSEMGVFVTRFIIFFWQFVKFEPIFSLCRFVRVW